MIMTEFITRNYGQTEFEIIIKTDNKEHYEAAENFARRLIDHAKPMTKADSIRAMSDVELARELSRIAIWDRTQVSKAKAIGLEKVMLDILQQLD
jgi:hypothetical protein